ncbi:serine/threonine protein kinase [Acidicapsa acidisoli]|uniref:serine/threonine protein kinase n=1 Tax=Acidicapsa acidisoli TaxID=1615681 RepID=UPI0021E06F1C|nr:serine/threonine-protein kinase [Acidicapsa acidisoli]
MLKPPVSNSEIPKTIGPFRVLRLLGVGGMGAVYLGERMEQFSQQVAIKILHPSLFPDAADGKIEREGELLAALEHPGVVRMLDAGITEDGSRYIVMEYVDGMPLDAYCDDHRLPMRRRVELLLDVLEAVEHAHRHLVVHADLKPENILVTAEGKPRLLDFGVATILADLGSGLGAAQPGSPAVVSEESVQDSYTVLYASPEQRAGERLTVASDIYSLGLIAQNILAGVKPSEARIPIQRPVLDDDSTTLLSGRIQTFGSDSLKSIAALRATTPGGLLAAIQGDLEAIVAKALRRNPAERFQSANQMREEFKRHLLGYPIKTRAAGRWTYARKWVLRNRLAACLGCVFLLVAIFSIVGVVRQATDAARKRQIAQTRLHDLVRLTDVLAGELYESVRGLQGAESAQAALLNSAHETINTLAAEDDQDTQLELELAGEYEKLARLELSRRPLTQDALRQLSDDLDRERRILDGMNRRDPEVLHLRERIPQMMQLRDAAAHEESH